MIICKKKAESTKSVKICSDLVGIDGEKNAAKDQALPVEEV